MSERGTYTVKEAGRKLGLGRNSTYEGIRKGEIPSIRIGNRILVPKAALDRMLSGDS
jgi:excisionase family DNA binding protein